jgi:hypothetical protein
MTMYYDPILDVHHKMGPTGGLAALPYLLPQDRQLAQALWDTAASKIGWNDPSKPVRTLPELRWLVLGVVLANEMGDTVSEGRLRETAEELCEPRSFGDGEFGWFFNFGEEWPRGQLSGLMAMTEVGKAGSWSRIFNEPDLGKFDQPTVVGVDYPTLGIAQARNEADAGVLHVSTYTGATSESGAATTLRIDNVADPDQVAVRCDGEEHTRWRILDAHLIEIETDIGEHRFQVLMANHRG